MKKSFLSLCAALALLLSLLPSAFADVYCNLGTFTAGTAIYELIPSAEAFPADVSIDTVSGLPEGCTIQQVKDAEQSSFYLAGTPVHAGEFTVVAELSSGESIHCSLSLVPAVPVIHHPSSLSCRRGETVTIDAGASAADAGVLSYQWYESEDDDMSGASAIPGAVDGLYSPDTSGPGEHFYFCIVTSNNCGFTTDAISGPLSVSVSAPELSSVSVTALPEKTEYTVGDSLDITGMELTATYDDGSTAVITEGYVIIPSRFSKAGTSMVEIHLENVMCSFPVDVKNAKEEITGIGVLRLPDKTDYLIGERPDTTGIVIRVSTSEGGHYDIVSGFECSSDVFTAEGRHAVEIGYGDKKCSFTVNVTDGTKLAGIELVRLPDVREYVVGDRLDTKGLRVQTVNGAGEHADLPSGYICTPSSFTKAGPQNITVSYNGQTAVFSVTVSAAPVPSPGPEPAPSPEIDEPVVPAASPEPEGPHIVQHSAHENKISKGIVVVVIIVAAIGLAGLSLYSAVLDNGGIEGSKAALKERLNRLKELFDSLKKK